ncbi:hypothetical protein F5X99DRAFT_211462 [Biscogniauxia marginata]|nr:hypothetical protein F5X99DRAFT_211462 [Biscogniauxia marginata]
MPRIRFMPNILSLLVGCCLIFQVVAPNCYHLDGSTGGPTNTLCNPNATFEDPACPQYCHDTNYDNAHLKSCNDTTFCCESDSDILNIEDCCNNAFRLTQPIGTVVAQLQSGVGAIPVATSLSSASTSTASTDIPSGAIAGLVVEGVVLALALLILGLLIWRNILLNRRLKEAKAETSKATASAVEMQQLKQEIQQYRQQQQYWQHPSSSVGGLPEMATNDYGNLTERGINEMSELATGLNTSEILDTEPPELSSSPRSPKPPFQ